MIAVASRWETGTRTLEDAWPAGAPSTTAPAARGVMLPGTPYVLVRCVGRGGMGEVYEVEHDELGRRAALKVLHPAHRDRPDLAARLRDEARLLAKLRHKNLIEVFDLGVTTDGRPYFAMPLLAGRDLRALLAAEGPMSSAKAAAFAAQALDGLAAAHGAGLVHRDVKLENLFLEEDGTLKLLDFGVAKIAGAARTWPGASPGTPRTMAPEQCAGGPVDARADLYAMGLALYELVTGRGPFDEIAAEPQAIRFAHCERAPIAPSRFTPAIDPALEAIILRALAKSPAERFQTAAQMAAALRRLSPRSPPSRARSRRRAGRAASPWIPAGAAVMAVAFFALGLAFGRTLPGLGGPDRPPVAAPVSKL